MTVVLMGGCGGGPQTTQQLTLPRSVSLSIRDNPPAGVTVLAFEINVTGASLQPADSSKPAVSLVTSPIEVELKQLETETAYLNGTNAVDGTYNSISLTFANPEVTILNKSGNTITVGTQPPCLNGKVCEFNLTLNQSSVTVSSAPFPVTISASSPIGLVVDFDLNSSIQNNLSVTPTVTLAAVSGQPNGEIEDLEGLVGHVQLVGSSSFVLKDDTSGQTFTINVDNNTKFEDFNQFNCAANNFSCVQMGQIVEVEHLLVMSDGSLLASEVQLEDAVNENQLEGIIVAVDPANNQFQMVVEDEEPAIQGVRVVNSVTISIKPGTQFSVDTDGLSGLPPMGSSFTSPSDLLVGQEVEVRALPPVTGTVVTTDRVRLSMSQFTGSVALVNAPNFTVNGLPTLFTSAGINQVQVQTSSATEFEGVSGVSALNVSNTVSLRGLLFKTAGDPILVAKKVRKR
jgi:hypothetical protein